MSIAPNLKKYLDKERVPYQILQHSEAYTASEIAGSQHVPGIQMLKSVLVKADGQFVLCVLPAIRLIDFDKLKKIIKSKNLDLANENEIAKLFPEYEVGAEPPFGNLYGLQVVADKSMEENDEILFNAGTHIDIVKIKLKDFLRLTQPKIADIGRHI